jgi:hypothetical protein
MSGITASRHDVDWEGEQVMDFCGGVVLKNQVYRRIRRIDMAIWIELAPSRELLHWTSVHTWQIR